MVPFAWSALAVLTIAIFLTPAATHAKASVIWAERSGTRLAVYVDGTGPAVLMIPSLGRGAEDFADLGPALAAAGFRAIRLQPRGIPPSTGPMSNVTMADLADDAARAIDAAGGSSYVVVGHAFGQRVARMLAARAGKRVRGVVMLAAGGKAPMKPGAAQALSDCFKPELSPERHLEAVRFAFFAPGNDPAVWRGGWYPEASRMQIGANRSTPADEWWHAGDTVPLLVIQGLDDTVAPPENGRLLKTQAGSRVTLVELEHAGHALLPEQPQAIAQGVIQWMRNLPE
jgi:pimeloyl-ACP methyl ester carboxylesterase